MRRMAFPFIAGFFVAILTLGFYVAFAQSVRPLVTVRYEIPLLIKTHPLSDTISLSITLESQATVSGTEIIPGGTQIEFSHETLTSPVAAITPTWILDSAAVQLAGAETTSQRLGTVTQVANLRAGPSTNTAVVRQLQVGDTVQIIGENSDGSWLQLDNQAWIAAFLVTEAGSTAPTRAPSSLPTPTPYPLTGIERHYIQQVKEKFTFYLPSLLDMQNTLKLAEQNPALLSDKTWLAEVVTYALITKTLAGELRKLAPSSRLSDAHSLLVEGTNAFDAAADLLLVSDDLLSADDYNKARSYMQTAFAKITDSLELIAVWERLGSR